MKYNVRKKKRILFICLGNICRSPAAHAVMQQLVDKAGLSESFEIESAAIGSWHIGGLPDERMRKHGKKRGYRIDHRARLFDARHDFPYYDAIYVMDEDNFRVITSKAQSEDERKKVFRLADYLTLHQATTIPDPYYGTVSDFEYALDLIEDACQELLRQLTLSS